MGDLKDNGQHHPQIERFMALVTLDKMCSETKKNSGFPPKTRPFSEPWLPWLRHPQGARPADRDAGGQGPGGPRGAGARRAPSVRPAPVHQCHYTYSHRSLKFEPEWVLTYFSA